MGASGCFLLHTFRASLCLPSVKKILSGMVNKITMSDTVTTQVRATAYTQLDKHETKQGTALSEEVLHASNITKTYTECSAVQVYWIFSYTSIPKERIFSSTSIPEELDFQFFILQN